MKRVLLYIGIVLAAIGCTKDADVADMGNNAMTFTTSIATRAEKSAWADSDHIGVYMTTSANATFGNGGENKDYAYAGNDSFSSTDPLHLPTSGSANILAYYPYESSVDHMAYSILSSAQVDLLRATATNVSSTDVSLTFKHQLSKISLTITNGTDVTTDDLDGLGVTISGIYTEATFDLESGEVNNDLSENSTSLTLTTSSTGTSSSAIVIPQELDDPTLTFTTKAGKKYSTTLSTTVFEVGKEYEYTVTIKENKVEITSATISGWDDGEATSGTADLFYDIKYDSSDKTYYIKTAAGLKAFASIVNNETTDVNGLTAYGISGNIIQNSSANGKLMNDINLSTICSKDLETNWTPIGNYSDSSNPKYEGVFDGNGYEVSGLYIDASTSYYQGLFGSVNGATISDLSVTGGSVTGRGFVGGVVGLATGSSTITGCYNSCTVTVAHGNGEPYVGGVVGRANDYATVAACYNSGTVSSANSDAYVGGVVGLVTGATATSCYSYGSVSGSGTLGGVVGTKNGSATVSYCYYDKTVIANYSATDKPTDVMGTIDGGGTATNSEGFSTTDMQGEDVVKMLNNGAYYYNQDATTTVGAWVYNSDGYPTYDPNNTPSLTALE